MRYSRVMLKHRFSLSALLVAGLFTIAPDMQAQLIVQGSSEAHACYLQAKNDLEGRRSSVRKCETALTLENLVRKDRAATLVNKGILQMRRGDHSEALQSYDAAVKLKPALAEAHINRGACLIFLSRPEDAIKALTRSIELETNHLPDALYNRAIAYERTGQIKEAYKDLKKAQSLRPDWERPTRALERFQVVSKNG